MSEIADARTRLHDQLVLYCAGAIPGGSVHRFTPANVASPCVWIAQPGVGIFASGNTRLRRVTFGIWIVADGDTEPQGEMLDELVARVADAIHDLSLADDQGAVPQAVDIGGVFTRAVVYDVAITTMAHSFCNRPRPLPQVAAN